MLPYCSPIGLGYILTLDGNVDGCDTAMKEAFETAEIYKVSSKVLESVETLSTDD